MARDAHSNYRDCGFRECYGESPSASVPLPYLPTAEDGLAMDVFEAVLRDLDAIRARDEDLADSALAATALALATEIDNEDNSATSKSMCAKALAEIMRELRELAPRERKADGIDAITDWFAERRAAASGGAEAAHLPHP